MKVTQKEFDRDIEEFKNKVLELNNGKPISMCMIMDSELIKEFAIYELDIAPYIRSLGLNAPTISEIFGVKIEITEK